MIGLAILEHSNRIARERRRMGTSGQEDDSISEFRQLLVGIIKWNKCEQAFAMDTSALLRRDMAAIVNDEE